ncbi:MAG: YjiH family protein [Pseudomonadota bacterium]
MRTALKFCLPSLLGVFAFLVPIRWDGDLTIPVGVLTGWVNDQLAPVGLEIVVAVTIITTIFTVLGSWLRPDWLRSRAWLRQLFDVSWIWVLIRLLGAVFGLMYLLQFGPEILQSDSLAGVVFLDIGFNVLMIYLVASFLLPLLTDYGFMEFVGTLARPIFRRVFRLPGRSAVDATTSIVSASSVGLLITIQQYDRGFYSTRQACTVATNFSIISIPFSLVVADASGIAEWFVPWYGIVFLATLIAAMITPRLPPLAGKSDTEYRGQKPFEESRDRESLLSIAWTRATQRAAQAPGLVGLIALGARNLMFFVFTVTAAAMALATLSALVTFETPLFVWLSAPLVGVLELAGLPEAAAAAPGLFSGFLDQFTPAVIAAGIESERTSFVLAGLSVTQLVFLSEAGVIILRSNLPLTLLDLLAIFLLRTAIVLPILIAGAHWIIP